MSRNVLASILLLSPFTVLAAGVELEPPAPRATSEVVRAATTAFATDRFLTVWEHFSGSGRHIYGAFSDAGGKRISAAAFPIVQNAAAESSQLIGLGDSFSLLWRDSGGFSHFAEVDRNGALVRRRHLSASWLQPVAAWNGEHMLVLGTPAGTSDIEAVLINRFGDAVTSPFPVGTAGAVQSVIALSDRSFVVLAGSFGDLEMVKITPAGSIEMRLIIENGGSSTTDYYGRGATAFDLGHGRMLIAFIGSQHGRLPILKTVVISADGLVVSRQDLGSTPYREIDRLFIARDERRLSIAFRGTREPQNGTEQWELASIPIDEDGRAAQAAPTVVASGFAFATAFTFARGDRVTLAVASPFNPPAAQIVSYVVGSGSAGSPEILSVTASRQSEVRIGANASGFIAAWNDNTATSAEVHLAALDAAGRPVSQITPYFGNLGSPRIVSGPTDHLFVRFTDRDLIATRVDARGGSLQEVVIAHASAREADAVWTGAGYLVVWAENGRLFTTHLAGQREVSVRELALPPAPAGYGRSASNARVAFDGSTALLAWIDSLTYRCGFPGCSWPEQTYVAMRISPTGEAVDAAPVTLGPVSGALLLAASDRNFLLLNRFDSARIITSGPDGLRIETTSIDLGFHVPHDVMWNGREYVAAVGALGRYVGVASISVDGTRHALHVRNVDFAQSLRVASRTDTTIVAAAVAQDSEPHRARTFAAGDFSELPAPPSQPSSHARVIGPGQVLLEWTAIPEADGYEIEVHRAGTSERLAVIYMDADATSRLVEWGLWATYTVRSFNAGGYSQPPLARRRSVRR